MAVIESPAPDKIRATRERAGITQTEAAELLHTSLRSFQQWEAGDRRMHPAFWELLTLKLKTRRANTKGV